MNIITLTSLEALIYKATNESLSSPDSAAIEAFLAVMKDTAEGPQLAAQALAARIHSLNPREALLALTMLDRCMRRNDTKFLAEIGKFRFLNEMIKLVSPKYYAGRTAPEVKVKIIQLFHEWATEHQKETKFKVALDMLKSQGVVDEIPPMLPQEENEAQIKAKAKNAIFEDDEKSKLLKRLLQSKKPEDLQHANRLIKTMVRDEEKRNEANSRRAHEVSAALDSAGLLRDMLKHAADASTDEEQLIHELHERCLRFRPVLLELASSNENTNNLDDIFHAKDVLDEVFRLYQLFTMQRKNKSKDLKPQVPPSNGDTLLDFAGASFCKGDGDAPKDHAKNNALDELGDIFSSESVPSVVVPLTPVNLMAADDVDILGDESSKTEGWGGLDSLGEQLLKNALPENSRRFDGFTSKPTKKIPMNALEKTTPKRDIIPNSDAMLDLDFFTKKPQATASISTPSISTPASQDILAEFSIDANVSAITGDKSSPGHTSPLDTILDLTAPLDNLSKCDKATPIDTNKNNVVNDKKGNEIKSLADINVTIDSVKPSKHPPLTAFEEEGGLTVVLHFCEDRPRPDVNVIVVSTTSKKPSPIEDFKFQAIVPKGCKARLLAASGAGLPACNPFLPPPALTQVLLLARPPAQRPPSLKFVVSYTCDDETVSEIGEVTHLPVDDI